MGKGNEEDRSKSKPCIAQPHEERNIVIFLVELGPSTGLGATA